MTEDELNSLIAHAHRRIEQLQRRMAEQQVMESQRIQQALQRQTQEDEKVADARVLSEEQRLLDDFAIDKQRWVSYLLHATLQLERSHFSTWV